MLPGCVFLCFNDGPQPRGTRNVAQEKLIWDLNDQFKALFGEADCEVDLVHSGLYSRRIEREIVPI